MCTCGDLGRAAASAPKVLDVTELPVGKWTEDYKATLKKLVEAGMVTDFTEHHTNSNVHFKLVIPKGRFLQPRVRNCVGVIALVQAHHCCTAEPNAQAQSPRTATGRSGCA